MRSTASSIDAVRINDLELNIHPDGSSVYVSLAIFHDLRKAGEADELQFSIDYSQIPNWLAALPNIEQGRSLGDINRIIAHVLARRVHSPPAFDVQIRTSHNHVVVLASYSIKDFAVIETHWIETTFGQCSASAIIGVNEDERTKLQDVKFDVTVKESRPSAIRPIRCETVLLRHELCQIVSETSFGTIEALSSWIAEEVLSSLYSPMRTPSSDPHQLQVHVSLKKPSAVPGASSAEVTISRSFCDYPSSFPPTHTVAIAFGSNLGDSGQNIEAALRLLETPAVVLREHHPHVPQDPVPLLTIVDTSFLYKTTPMYVTDQPPFINGACMVETNLSPETLLLLVKTIESVVGRVPSVRFGPRAVDLDIIFYDDISIDIPSKEGPKDISYLTIPHVSVREREFVLRPLNDMIPTYVHPSFGSSVSDLLKAVENPDEPMLKTIPFPRGGASTLVPETDLWWDHGVPPAEAFTASENAMPRTKVMATLNATPDSFSDGADHAAVRDAVRYVVQSVQDGASIIDVGGYSTRPGAAFVSVEEEITRVVPIIRAIRQFEPVDDLVLEGPISAEDVRRVPISVDTFRWEVAEAAILAGANCINDVYGFTGPAFGRAGEDFSPRDPLPETYMREMRKVARKHAVPVILMHSRGDAGKHKDYAEYAYAEDSATLEGIRVELGRKIDMVLKGKGGVRRWLVIVDPGVGFSKTLQGNLDVIKQGNKVVAKTSIGKDRTLLNPLRGFPLLVGPSRKSFLGAILQQTKLGKTTIPKEREWATGAVVSELVKNRTLSIRVHNVKDMMDTIRTTEALYP